jgi:hypothetical protein
MREDFEQAEYFVLTEAVAEFDRRLLTIKGWGVSVSLVAVGLGFQYRAFGFFLIAAASSLAFWATGAVTKRQERDVRKRRLLSSQNHWSRAYAYPFLRFGVALPRLITFAVSIVLFSIYTFLNRMPEGGGGH